jgi:Methyltransferase domain
VDARYDAVADFDAQGWPDSGDDPVARALLGLCGDVAGEQSWTWRAGMAGITRQLAGRGAIVTRTGIPAALIARGAGAERRQPTGIRCLQAGAAAADWLPGTSFGAAVCGFGLSDIDDLDGALASTARVTRADGRFAFPVLPPCFPGGLDACGAWPRGRLLPRRGMAAGRPIRILAVVPGRGEGPDPARLPQRTAAARPVAGRPDRASPARMGRRPARRRPHARLPRRQMPPAITARAAAVSGHQLPARRRRPGTIHCR